MSAELRTAIERTARKIGVSPLDLATTISFETAGTLHPWQKGSVTKHGLHRGLIQWGESQRRDYGVTKEMSVTDQVAAAGRYLQDRGVRPGDGLLQLYSAINAGGVGEKYYNRSDTAAGGTPGTVRDKVRDQMGGHKRKAAKLLAGGYDGRQVDQAYKALPDEPSRAAPPAPAPGTPQSATPNPYGINLETPAPFSNQTGEEYGLWQGIKGSARTDWMVSWMASDMGGRAPDPDYTFPKDEQFLGEMKERGIDERYWSHVMGAGSEVDYAERVKFVEGDIETNRRLGEMGGTGIGIRFLMGVLDPTAIAFILATEGAAIPAVASLKLGRLASILTEGGIALGLGGAYEGIAAQKNPNITDADIAMVMGLSGLLGGAVGAWRGNKNLKEEAQALSRASKGLMERHSPTGDLPSGNGPTGAGASVNEDFIPHYLGDDAPEIDLVDAPEAALNGKWRLEGEGQNMRSPAPLTKTLTPHFVEMNTGMKGGGEVPMPNSMRGQQIHESAMLLFNQYHVPAMRTWAKENKLKLNDTNIQEYDRLTFEATYDQSALASAPKSIQDGVKANARFYAHYNDLIDNPGVHRGEIVDPLAIVPRSKNYVPLITDAEALNASLFKHGHEHLEKAVEFAMRQGPLGGQISDALLKRMARGYITKILRAQNGMEDGMEKAFTMGSKDDFKAALEDAANSVDGAGKRFVAGMSETDVDDLVANMFGLIDDLPNSAAKGGKAEGKHLKRRTLMDYGSKYTYLDADGVFQTIRPLDFFVKNSTLAANRYGRQMSGRVSMAQMKVFNPTSGELIVNGIRSRADFDKLMNWVRADHSRIKYKSAAARNAARDRDIANFEHWYRDSIGAPHLDQNAPMNKWMRRIGNFNFIRLMNNMGWNQFQEFSRIGGMAGMKAFTQQMPAFRRLVDVEGKSLAKMDELLDETQAMTGMGTQTDFPRNYINRKADENISVEFEGLDKALDKGSRITSNLALMHHLMDIQQNWALKSFSQQMFNFSKKVTMADGSIDLTKLKKMQRHKMETVGLGDEKMIRVIKEINKHAKTVDGKGKRLDVLNTANWDDLSVKAEFSDTLVRLVNRAVHRNDIGSLNRLMHSNAAVQMMTQFRAFVIGSFAKSTLYNLAHLDMRTFATMALELMAAAGTYTMITGIRSLGRSDREEFLEERLSWQNIAAASYARAAFASVTPMAIDTILRATPLQPQFDYRTSGTAMDAFTGAPAFDIVNSGMKFSSGMLDSLFTGRSPSQAELKSGIRAFGPFANWLPMMPLLNLMVGGLPEKKETQ